jgi:hypothetical protein
MRMRPIHQSRDLGRKCALHVASLLLTCLAIRGSASNAEISRLGTGTSQFQKQSIQKHATGKNGDNWSNSQAKKAIKSWCNERLSQRANIQQPRQNLNGLQVLALPAQFNLFAIRSQNGKMCRSLHLHTSLQEPGLVRFCQLGTPLNMHRCTMRLYQPFTMCRQRHQLPTRRDLHQNELHPMEIYPIQAIHLRKLPPKITRGVNFRDKIQGVIFQQQTQRSHSRNT